MDEDMIRDVAAHLAQRLNDALADVTTTHVELTRDEAVLALGLIEGVQEILVAKATASPLSRSQPVAEGGAAP